jgi:hypothetical protein
MTKVAADQEATAVRVQIRSSFIREARRPLRGCHSLHVWRTHRQQDHQRVGPCVAVCCSMQEAPDAAEGVYDGSRRCQRVRYSLCKT